jgi:hypothetical protein
MWFIMKNYQPHPIQLDAEMVEYLEEVAKTYNLPDIGKAIRCLINYVGENPDRRDEIFGEIRCHC